MNHQTTYYPTPILLEYLSFCTLPLLHTYSSTFKRHPRESTDHGIQPRLQYWGSSRRREAHKSIHIRCSFLSLQRPGMARQASSAMDPPGNGHRCPTGQLRPQCRASTTPRRVRGSISTYRCVPIQPSSNSSLTRVTAIGLLVMMYPILCKVKFETLHLAFGHRTLWIQIGFSIVMNWLVAPFLMVSYAAHDISSFGLLIGFCPHSWASLGPFFLTSRSFAMDLSWSV